MSHFEIVRAHENEPWEETMSFIDKNRNWDVATQQYKKPEAETSQEKLSTCKIYWRGQYLIVEDSSGMVHYWENEKGACYLQQAVEYMELHKPAEWKTLDKLISLRMGIRQTEVNCCGYVDSILFGESMTETRYKKFMRLARAQDLQHHGSHTF